MAFQGMRRGPRRRDLGWGKKVEEETHSDRNLTRWKTVRREEDWKERADSVG